MDVEQHNVDLPGQGWYSRLISELSYTSTIVVPYIQAYKGAR